MFANNSSSNDEWFKGLSDDKGTCFLFIDYVAVRISYTIINSILLLASLTGDFILTEIFTFNVLINFIFHSAE